MADGTRLEFMHGIEIENKVSIERTFFNGFYHYFAFVLQDFMRLRNNSQVRLRIFYVPHTEFLWL